MAYKTGRGIEFNMYGTIVKGVFIDMDGNDKIKIKTLEDPIEENIGEEQSIHKTFPHKMFDINE